MISGVSEKSASLMSGSSETFSVLREEQPENTSYPIVVTEFGISMLMREEHPSNASHTILVTEFGKLTDVSEVQLLKVAISILITEFGISMPVKKEHLENALPSI